MARRNFHKLEDYLRGSNAAADPFYRGPRDAKDTPRAIDSEVHPLDARKTAFDLGRVDEGWGPTPVQRHPARG